MVFKNGGNLAVWSGGNMIFKNGDFLAWRSGVAICKIWFLKIKNFWRGGNGKISNHICAQKFVFENTDFLQPVQKNLIFKNYIFVAEGVRENGQKNKGRFPSPLSQPKIKQPKISGKDSTKQIAKIAKAMTNRPKANCTIVIAIYSKIFLFIFKPPFFS